MENMGRVSEVLEFYRGKRIFVTGHTGFKGAWLCQILASAGAEVTGYALPPQEMPNLYSAAGIGGKIVSVFGDIRDFGVLKKAFDEARPEIVFHLAAQPIVRESYREPRRTYEINVMGTVNLLECARQNGNVRSVLNVTTDKVYRNNEWVWGYREDEFLDGRDPYSNSKSCSELVTHSYRESFFDAMGVAVSTARAGNVIGGGDFAHDRIIPDCVRAVQSGQTIVVRNPLSIRPYQHVLEPLCAYLMIAKGQCEDRRLAGWYNVGPSDEDCVTTGELATLFCEAWGAGAKWECAGEDGEGASAPEANVLKLDCAKIKAAFGWKPRWHIAEAVGRTRDWTKVWLAGGDAAEEMNREIADYGREEA